MDFARGLDSGITAGRQEVTSLDFARRLGTRRCFETSLHAYIRSA